MRAAGVVALCAFAALSCAAPAPAPPADSARTWDVRILRDTWGVPHVRSDTDNGAMYGLGYDVD